METVKKILDIQVKYDDAISGIAKYSKEIDRLKRYEEVLKKSFKDKTISQEEFNLEMADSEKKIMKYKDTVQTLTKYVRNQVKAEQQQAGSLKQLRAQLSNLTEEYDSLSEAERKAAKGQELKKKINDITGSLKEAEGETQRFYRSVGSYEDSIKGALGMNNSFASSLLDISQNSKGIKGLFSNVKGEVSAFGNTLTSLLGNKVFLGIAGIAGVGVAFKWWYDYNKGLVEATKLTKQFTDKSGDDLKMYRTEVQALSDYYGKDFKEMLISANAVSKQFGITTDESLKLIKDGFISGADANGEFLSNLKEYPAYFKEAGISADQFIAITSQANKAGIFSDKGIDAIKEANIRIREMTKSTASALDGIGISSKKVQEELQSGSTTTFKVMQLVSEKLNELPESSSVVGTAIADIFGGPGEDAGLKYIRTLKDVSTSLDEVKDKAGELGRIEEDLIASQTELSSEVAKLFDSTGGSFERMTSKVKTFINEVLADLIKVVRESTESIEDIANRDRREARNEGATNGQNALKDEYSNILNLQKMAQAQGLSENEALKKAKDARLKILKISLSKEEELLKQYLETNEKYNKELEDSKLGKLGFKIRKGIQSSWEKMMKQVSKTESLKTQIEGITNYDPTKKEDTATIKDKNKGKDKKKSGAEIDTKKKEIEEVRKSEDEILKLIKDSREKQSQEIEYQYDRQIEDLKARLSTEKGLTPRAKEEIGKQIIALEKQKDNDLDKLSDEQLRKDIAKRQKLIELELETVKSGSEKEYRLKIQQLSNNEQAELTAIGDTEEKKKEIKDRYANLVANENDASKLSFLRDAMNAELSIVEEGEQTKLLIKQKYSLAQEQLIKDYNNNVIKKQQDAIKLRFETEIAQAYGNETEILRIKMEQKRAELAALQQFEGESLEAFNLRKLQIGNEYLDAKKDVADKEISIEQAKFSAMSDVTNGLISLTEAIGESDEDFAMASKVLALAQIAINTGEAIAKMVSAESGKGIVGIATMAAGIGAILANIANAIKTVKSAKFATGGRVIGPGTGTSDSIPADLSNGESVLTARATEMFTPLLSAFNMMGGGVPINVTTTSNQTIGEDMLARAVAKGMMMAPPPVVSIEEFTSVANRVKYLEDLGKL